jgi:hypothetical protein
LQGNSRAVSQAADAKIIWGKEETMDTDKKRTKRSKGIIPIVISLVALGASMFSLYESYLRPGRINITVSENIEFFYRVGVGNLGVILSATISNDGAKSTTMQKVALLIQQPGVQGGYLLEAIYYMHMTEEGNIVFESRLAPLTIASRDTEIKHIFFQSSLEHPDESPLTGAGTYDLKLLAWCGESLHPKIEDSFSVFLSEQNLSALEEGLKKGIMKTEVVPILRWKSWQAHSLTENELTELLRTTRKE